MPATQIQNITIEIKTIEGRKIALKEDIKYILKELWDLEEEEPLCKIFTRECLEAKIIKDVLQCSKAEIKDL